MKVLQLVINRQELYIAPPSLLSTGIPPRTGRNRSVSLGWIVLTALRSGSIGPNPTAGCPGPLRQRRHVQHHHPRIPPPPGMPQRSAPRRGHRSTPCDRDGLALTGKAMYEGHRRTPGGNDITMHKRIGLVVKDEAKARRQADQFERWLIRQGHDVHRQHSRTPGERMHKGSRRSTAPTLFCVFVLGGDGTFLSAVRWIGDRQIPIIGVKFGEVGFLAEATEDRLRAVAEAILANHFTVRPQMRLRVRVLRQDDEIARESAFNDMVINKGALARLARIRTHIDGQFLTEYRADGLIVATPTGSTAYSLAAGGPIIHPSVPGILITPICPFTLTNRPLMVPETATITIQLVDDTSDIMLTSDGQIGLQIDERDVIVIDKSPHPVQMITLPDQNYFDVLKAKLKWSGSRV